MEAISGWLTSAFGAFWAVMGPHRNAPDQPFWSFIGGSLVNMARSYFWFLLIGMVIYLLFIRRRGERLSLWAGLKYLLPASVYKTHSVRIDLLMVPIAWIDNFLLLAGLAVGSGVVQIWLVQHFGHSVLQVPAGVLAVTLQIVFTLLGTDMARFAWHLQGHKIPFFWEFHKGHHSAEALHPVFIRTHPVDMFIRTLYMDLGGGLVGGGLMFLVGVDASPTAAGLLAIIGICFHFMQQFEHSHVKFSFGDRLERIFYPPHFHQIHHSALPEHRDKNLGLTGGLCLWDKLAGTLYIPKPGEKIIFGASMEELGDNNPHRTLWGFLSRPFVEAVRSLWPRSAEHPDLLDEKSGYH
jgi:sterol desaturase/sphingolipid hydroxylase (fatty acid hydroxylase superfamily)